MTSTLTVIDDFCPAVDEVREQIIGGSFTTKTGPDGAPYTNINTDLRSDIIALMEKALGFEIELKMTFARYDLVGEMPHSFVHSDTICADYAAILYLNKKEQCTGGTAFWTHRFLGLDHMPSNEDIESHTWDPMLFKREMQRDWKKLELWNMTGLVGMKCNRFVCYPTKMFHSRFPHEGFGTTKEDGRLIWVCFFNKAPILQDDPPAKS